jgi:hypothetical protein
VACGEVPLHEDLEEYRRRLELGHLADGCHLLESNVRPASRDSAKILSRCPPVNGRIPDMWPSCRMPWSTELP